MNAAPFLRLAMYFMAAFWFLIPSHAGASVSFTLSKSSYSYGESIPVTWTRDSTEVLAAKDWIGIYKEGQTPGGGPAATIWRYVNGSQTAGASVQSGAYTFTNPGLAAGNYVAHFLRDDGYGAIATPVTFIVLTTPAFTLNKTTYAPGEAITGTWSRPDGSPLFVKDWMGIYLSTATPASSISPAWNYLNNSRTAPATPVQSGSMTLAVPTLAEGTYKAYIFGNDGYGQVVPPVTFTIASTPAGGPALPQFVMSPFRLRHAISGAAYTGCVRGYAKDADANDVLAFSKTTGPGWLTISATGVLSGTPASSDAGMNSFTVKATDLLGNEGSATFSIEVFKPGTEHVGKLRVLSYNLFHGWSKVNGGLRKGIDSIILSNADVVCTQESTDNVSGSNAFRPQQVADELGWYFTRIPNSGDLGIISRYPIAETFPASIAVGARVTLCSSPLQEVIVYSTHLDYLYYGPYKAAEAGSTEQSTMTEELKSQRDEQAAALMTALQVQLTAADTTPVLVCGDFNAPSHLDWTSAASASHYGKAIAWPATVALANAGLMDSFRQIHPDPVATPGITWAPIYSGDEPLDRIDFVFSKGRRLKAITSEVYHTAVEVTVPNYSSSLTPIMNNTWPSDHAGVLTEFTMTPTDTAGDGMPDYWENLCFGGAAPGGATGDPDGDGIPNLIEFALGTPPTAADGIPVAGMHREPDGMRFHYLRPKAGEVSGDFYIADDLKYRVVRSADLSTWTPAADFLTPDGEPTPEGDSLEKVSFMVTPPTEELEQFFRLAVVPR